MQFTKSQFNHCTETNSSEGRWVWFEGPCPIPVSVSQNNYWLVAEGNLENLCPREAGGFFIWELKKVARLKQCPLYGFYFRDA